MHNVCCVIHGTQVDVDALAGVAQRYQVRSMPTFVFIKGGQEVARFSGASVEKLRATIAQHM
jgi:thioredoxin 1